MLQVSSYNSNFNTSYGSKNSASTKVIKNVISKPETSNVKKAFGLGAIIAGLFGAKKTVTEIIEPKKSKAFEYREEKVYDENGKLTNILKYSKADDVLSISIAYDKETGKKKQQDWYRKDGQTPQYTEKYDSNEKKYKTYWFDKDGQTIRWVEEYDKSTKYPKEITYFDKKGNINLQIQADDETGMTKNRFNYDEKGNLKSREEVSGLTGKTTRKTTFNEDYSKKVEEFDINSGKKIAEFLYNKNNDILEMEQYDNQTAKKNYFKINEENFSKNENQKQKYSRSDLKNIYAYLANRYAMEHAE